MTAYYNEFDPKAAAWLRELIKAGLIAQGDVDERSICDVRPDDIAGYTQCHFFAGIGGWSLALRLAGWPDARPVWTGSCPCQPFSCAGKGLAQEDPRHLWPEFHRLIRERRPDICFGEQVEAAIGKGWLDGVFGDLEAEGYACGAAVLGAHSVGSPHIRQRVYWVADSQGERWQRSADSAKQAGRSIAEAICSPLRLADSLQPGLEGHSGDGDDWNQSGWIGKKEARSVGSSRGDGGLGNSNGERRDARRTEPGRSECFASAGCHGGVGNAQGYRQSYGRDGISTTPGTDDFAPWREGRDGNAIGIAGCHGGMVQSDGHGCTAGSAASASAGYRSAAIATSVWNESVWHPCRDNKLRRIPAEPAFFPLADGVPARVVRLRGYGNAIVPQAAQAFVEAYLSY